MKKGFTIIEMLIVVTIIAVLSGLILRGMGGALPKSRDARRLGDLKNVQNMLEMYYNASNPNTYPNVTTGWTDLESKLQSVLGTKIKLPQDPSGGTNTYHYCPNGVDANGTVTGYILGAQLEVTSSTDSITGLTCDGKTCGENLFYCVGM